MATGQCVGVVAVEVLEVGKGLQEGRHRAILESHCDLLPGARDDDGVIHDVVTLSCDSRRL